MKNIIIVAIAIASQIITEKPVPFEYLGYEWEEVAQLIESHEWEPVMDYRDGDEIVVTYQTHDGKYATVRYYA